MCKTINVEGAAIVALAGSTRGAMTWVTATPLTYIA